MNLYLETQRAYRLMSEEKTLPGLYNEAAISDAFMEYAQSIEDALQKQFPKSYVKTEVIALGGNDQPAIRLKVLAGNNKNEWPNGIPTNDRFYHGIMIFTQGRIQKGEDLPAEFRVESGQGTGYIHYDNHNDPYVVYKSLKTGWRNFKASPDKVIPKLQQYFKKLSDLLKQNKDLFKPEIQQLFKNKGII